MIETPTFDDGIFQAVSNVADERGDRVAVEFEGKEFSYSWLINEATQIAIELTKSGVRYGDRVGVLLGRSPALIAALLAVFRVGGAYVPLDPSYPASRIAFMAEDSRLSVIIGDLSSPRDVVPERVNFVNPFENRCGDSKLELLPLGQLRANDWAYVMYTSGSTGRPKGVAVSHRSVLAMLRASIVLFGRSCFRISLASTSISFDPSVLEIFGPLCCGGALRLVQSVFETAPSNRSNQATLIVGVPSLISAGVTHGTLHVQGATLALGGEQLLPAVVDYLYDEGAERVFNVYGPTEDTTFSTAALISRDDIRPAIGESILGSFAYILGIRGERLGQGVEGEIFLGGDGLADGYLFRPGATAASFQPDPFSGRAGSRMYRTGDRGILRADGLIEYRGRGDDQTKVNGVRVELGEVENALLSLSEVQQCSVFVQNIGTGQRLAAYIVAPSLGKDGRAVRSELQRRLPPNFIPSVISFVDSIPRLPNGKIDTASTAGT